MEFHALRQEFLNEVQLLKGVIQKKSTMPILGFMLVEAYDQMLSLKASDLDVGYLTKIPAQIIQEGGFCIDANRLALILGKSKGSMINFLGKDDSKVNILADEGKIRFQNVETMNVDIFPEMPQADLDFRVNISRSFLLEAIQLILLSVSGEVQRYVLNGCQLNLENGQFTLASTDGHRLSVLHSVIEDDDVTMNCIIPKKALMEMKKLLSQDDGEDQVQLSIHENRLFLKCGDRVLFTSLIDGNFPGYQKAIPENNDKIFRFNRSQLLEIMERKLIFISDNSKSVRFYFHQDLLEISLTNNELGSSQDQFDIDYQGPSFEVGYNCQYIADFLKTVPYEFVDLHVKDAGNQAIWTVGQDDLPYDYKHVIMPLRIHD